MDSVHPTSAAGSSLFNILLFEVQYRTKSEVLVGASQFSCLFVFLAAASTRRRPRGKSCSQDSGLPPSPLS